MRTYITQSCFYVMLFGIVFVLVSFLLALKLQNADLLASSGAVLTVCGIYLSFSHTILLSSKDDHKLMCNKLEYSLFLPDEDSPHYNQQLLRAKQFLYSERIGFGLSVIGTVIWAYGGYIKI